jgi:hypothetical protein
MALRESLVGKSRLVVGDPQGAMIEGISSLVLCRGEPAI